MKLRLVLASLLCFAVAGCSEQKEDTQRLEGSYGVKFENKIGSVRVTGGGDVTLGANCAMDITLNSSGGQTGDSTNRYVRAPGGPTFVSHNDGEWSTSMGDTGYDYVRRIAPLVAADHQIDNYGDSFCWFGLLHKFASGSEHLEFSTERFMDLYSRSLENSARESAQRFGTDPQVVACVSKFLTGLNVGQRSVVERSFEKTDASLTTSQSVVTYKQHPVNKAEPQSMTVTFTPQNAPVITAPVSVTTTIPTHPAELAVAEGCTADHSFAGGES